MSLSNSLDNVNIFLLQAKFLKVIVDSNASWEVKFDLAFETIAPAIRKTGVRIEWRDPDMSYEDDVLAYHNAVQDRVAEFRKIALWGN